MDLNFVEGVGIDDTNGAGEEKDGVNEIALGVGFTLTFSGGAHCVREHFSQR